MYKFAFEHESGDRGYYVEATTVSDAEAKFRARCDEMNKKMLEEYGRAYPDVQFDNFMIVRIYEIGQEAPMGGIGGTTSITRTRLIWDIHNCEPFPCHVVCP